MHNAVDAYALSVVDGQVPAGKYHRLACVRHLSDRDREGSPDFPYEFVYEKADRFFRFAQKLKHYKGTDWAGKPIILEPHQIFRKGCKYGWIHRDTGLRRFRNSYEEIPRKNGKTIEAAIELVYLTFFDGEPGAEGYCAATKRDQALIVFNDCKQLVLQGGLRDRLTVQVSNIHDDRTASKLEPLSADYNSMDGLNPHAVALDELHAYKFRGTIDVMETGTGARSQPLINKITTAGNDLVSPCGDEHEYACQILEGTRPNDTYFAFIAHADPEDDWTLPETARKANPNYGVSVKPDDLASKVIKAQGIPEAAASYQQKHLNLWVNTDAPSLSVDGWRQGQSTTWQESDLLRQPCWVGIDLSSKIDLCSLTLLFPIPPHAENPQFKLIQRIWTPADTVRKRAHEDRVPYEMWVKQGWLIAAPGTQINHAIIRDELRIMRSRYELQLIGFDPWHSDQIKLQLTDPAGDGWPADRVLDVPQTFAGMTSAELKFKGATLAGSVDARGCPVTAWAVSNVIDQTDGKGNILFSKKKSRGRIDPVKSATIAMSLWLKQPLPVEPSYTVLVVGGR